MKSLLSKSIYLSLILLLSAANNNLFAKTINSKTGNCLASNNGHWTQGGLGDPNDDVYIPTGSYVTIDMPLIIKNLTIEPGASLTIDFPMEITGMTINSGTSSLTLNLNSTLTVAGTDANPLIGFSNSKYFIVGTNGKLLIKNIGGLRNNLWLPIGVNSYSPVKIENTPGYIGDFSAGLVNNVKINGLTGAGVEDYVVKRTWDISKTSGTANVKLTFQWNATDQSTNFNYDFCSIRHYTGGIWTADPLGDRAATLVSGSRGTLNAVYSISRSGITTFSPFAIGDILSPLPVEMVSFKAIKHDAQVLLNWETASEKNNAGFEIQASTDSRKYETVGYVASKNGNANYSQRYEFLDKTIRTGLVYYRLKQTDLDGTAAYYAAKVVDMGKTSDAVVAYPNPFKDQFEVKVAASSDQHIELMVTDLTGKVIFQSKEPVTNGTNNLKVHLQNYPAGIYLLTAKTAEQAFITRLVKQ